MLVVPIGGTEKQVALQAQALQFAAVSREQRKLSRTAIQRAAIFRAVEGELDDVDATGAQGERGAAEDHSDRDAGQEAPPHNDQSDREQRQVFEPLELAGAAD